MSKADSESPSNPAKHQEKTQNHPQNLKTTRKAQPNTPQPHPKGRKHPHQKII